ncbi:hypothetical protein TNCV_1974651 [Trichonephila clavipes]|nr:hypothetical protein TNCV_1974651 [Trichonephila clavipes]
MSMQFFFHVCSSRDSVHKSFKGFDACGQLLFQVKVLQKDLIDELKIFGMSSRQHIDYFIRGRIIGKIEEGRKITDVAREFDIAHSVVSWLWKSFKTTGMCSRWHGEVVFEVRRLQKTDISSYQQKGTGAPQLSRWQISFLQPQESRSPEKLLPDV